MMRGLWLAACLLVPALLLAVPATFLWATWTLSGRMALTGVILTVLCLPVVPAYWIWTEDHRPAPLLPRRERRRIRSERARIAAEAEIARLEREAGIR